MDNGNMFDFFSDSSIQKLPNNVEELKDYLMTCKYPRFAIFTPDEYDRLCSKIIEIYSRYSISFTFLGLDIPPIINFATQGKKINFWLGKRDKKYEIFFSVSVDANGIIREKKSFLLQFQKMKVS